MTFQAPWVLSLLLVIPLLMTLPKWSKRHQRRAALRYSAIQITDIPVISWRLAGRFILPALRWLLLILLIIALARPQIVQTQQIINGDGLDIVLALDISGSMASLDFEPQNRLEAAKKVIEDFIAERAYDRIGLTVFASEAFSQSPLTIDHAVLSRLLDQVKLATDLRLDDGTAIGLGLATAANMLKESDAKSKVIILLTDGVNNAGQIDPLTAAEATKTLGIKVYTIGVGRPGLVPVPQQTLFGPQIVMQESQLDETTLKQIAEKTDGLYFRAQNTAGLQEIYDEINNLEKSKIEIRVYERYQELANWLLLPAFIIMLIEMTLRLTLFRKIP